MVSAVGSAPGKLGRVKGLRDAGGERAVVLDSVEQARAVVDAAAQLHDKFPPLIEIDCDGHRSGLGPDDPRLVEVGRILHDGGVELGGVMTHAGRSEEHTSELQSLMRISYAVFCLKKKNNKDLD